MAEPAPERPWYLDPSTNNAARFQESTVVERYHLRLPYPPEIFTILLELLVDEPRAVLDVGTGTGELARELAPHVERVDAVDISAPMLARGQTMPGGAHPHLRWLRGAAEDVPLDPPYALVTAGDSLHWMDWDTVLPRFARVLTPRGVLAIVHRKEAPAPWQAGLVELIQRYSTYQHYVHFDLLAELEARGLYERRGERQAAPVEAMPAIDEYVEAFHSMSSLSLDHMAPEAAAAFDQGLRELVAPWSRDGRLMLQTTAGVAWGRPRAVAA